MRRVFVFLVASMLAVALLVPGAHAATKHRVSGTLHAITLSASGTPPAAGSKVVDVGTLNTRPGGAGAAILTATFLTSPSPGTYPVKGTGRAFYQHGSLSFKFMQTATLQPNGSVSYAGKGTITGGTDTFSGARGRFTFNGSAATPASAATLTLSGSVTY